jgi:hypothetical protein
MAVFKIHRLREHQQQSYRWAPHASGSTPVKPKDYNPAGEVEAEGVYEAWTALRDSSEPLRVGDLLELENGTLRICKYVGFEEAQWVIPEPKPPVSQEVPPAATPEAAAAPGEAERSETR